jgi:hypothetical protein
MTRTFSPGLSLGHKYLACICERVWFRSHSAFGTHCCALSSEQDTAPQRTLGTMPERTSFSFCLPSFSIYVSRHQAHPQTLWRSSSWQLALSRQREWHLLLLCSRCKRGTLSRNFWCLFLAARVVYMSVYIHCCGQRIGDVLQQTEVGSHTTGCGGMSIDFTTLRRGKEYCRNGAVKNGFPSAALAPPAK